MLFRLGRVPTWTVALMLSGLVLTPMAVLSVALLLVAEPARVWADDRDDRDRDRDTAVPMDKPTGSVAEKDKPEGVVKIEDVGQYANQKYDVTVKLEIKSSAHLKSKDGKPGLTFLNSESNFKDAKNFVVLIPPAVLAKFKTVGIEEPHNHYKGKTVVVTGKVSTYKNKPQIVVFNPDNIKIDGAPAGGGTSSTDRDR